MENLSFASILELKALLAAKKISHSELISNCSNRFAQYDSALHSALEIFDKDSILSQASYTGPLDGIPGLIKDNIAQNNRKLTCASKILEPFVSSYDATVIARLKAAGALLAGRANMDEFAMGSSTETSAFGITRNPWDPTRVPGGSSGGSVAAVAAGFVPWSLGSETGGSVRQPAAFCGVVGSKPTYGRVSRYGLVAYASSLDQVGICTRTVADNALVFSVIAGHDPHDSTSLQKSVPDIMPLLDGKLPAKLKIGIVENALGAQGMDASVVNAIEHAITIFESLGAQTVKVALPTLEYTAAAYFILSRAEAASNLARFDGVRYGFRAESPDQSLEHMYTTTRHNGFGAEVRRRIMVGNYVLQAGHADKYYENARRVQNLMRQEFIDTFKKVDLLIMPTHPAPAFKIGAFDNDKLQMDLQDYFTCPANLAGVPAISIPCGMSPEKLPIGFQIVAPHLGEPLMFQAAHAYEKNTPWHTMRPQGY